MAFATESESASLEACAGVGRLEGLLRKVLTTLLARAAGRKCAAERKCAAAGRKCAAGRKYAVARCLSKGLRGGG
jgi:hypothetical protein